MSTSQGTSAVPAIADGALLLHLHGFKCAGTTFAWSLERALEGSLAYVESPEPGDRLDWRHVRDHLQQMEHRPQAVTSHLATLPPEGEVAALKVAFLRQPMARLSSAFRFQVHVQKSIEPVPFRSYLQSRTLTILANYQTRHLSPQEPMDWLLRKGWGLRPELIDLARRDLFVGVVERYDESIVALEHQLQSIGRPLDLAYPGRLNTTSSDTPQQDQDPELESSPVALALTELDQSLYRRAERRLEERLALIPDLEAKLSDFQRRRSELLENPPNVSMKPNSEWVHLPMPVA